MQPTVIATLETVTPLFLAGADPRAAPELRPPAFRGALRYWLRAALGGVLGDAVEPVRKAEAAVFGSTDERLGGAGAVTVRITHTELPSPVRYQRGPAQRVSHGGRQTQQPSGRDYLYWSMAATGSRERGNVQPPKQYLAPGAQFRLHLAVRPGAPDPERALRHAEAALWLLVQLGGVGSRSRRTGGSLSAVGVAPGDDRYGLALQGRTVAEVAAHLKNGLTRLRGDLGQPASAGRGIPPLFDILRPEDCRIWALSVWANGDQAVDAIGAAMRDFRNRRDPDHQQVARWLTGSSIREVQRAAFGLPLPVRYTGRPSGVIQGGDGIDRRASPLWLKVSRLPDGRAVGVATLFKSQFLSPGEQLHAQGAGPPVAPPEDYGLIERFITERFPGAVEVDYA